MKKVVWPGEVLLLCKRRGRVAKIRRVIVKKLAAILPGRAACERDAHGSHRLYGCSLHRENANTPFTQRMLKRSTGCRHPWNHLLPHGSGLRLKRCTPLASKRI